MAVGAASVSAHSRASGNPGPRAGSPLSRGRAELCARHALAPTRPIRLFARPEPIEAIAEVPDGPPVQFSWRHVLHEVAHVEGPERIAMEWWRDEAGHTLMRDYFRVESREGVRVWLFREWPARSSEERADALVPARRVRMSNVVQLPDKHKKTPQALVLRSPDPSHTYAELAVTTHFSFLRGASSPKELVPQAIALGLAGIGIADRNSVAGVVRAYHELEEMKEHFRLEHGVELPPIQASRRRAARLRRRHAGYPRLSAEPHRMGPPHAPAHRRQEPRREGRMHPLSRRPDRAHRRPQSHRDAAGADQDRCNRRRPAHS